MDTEFDVVTAAYLFYALHIMNIHSIELWGPERDGHWADGEIPESER